MDEIMFCMGMIFGAVLFWAAQVIVRLIS